MAMLFFFADNHAFQNLQLVRAQQLKISLLGLSADVSRSGVHRFAVVQRDAQVRFRNGQKNGKFVSDI